mgnify:CR=1 FL=1
MKFTIDRQALLTPLQSICTVVEKKQTLPILSNVLLATQGDKLLLTGTDLEVELIAEANLNSNTEDASITVPARKLLDICKNLPEQSECKFSLTGSRLTLATQQSKFTLSTQPAGEFPNIDTGENATDIMILESDFKGLLEKTYFAMAQQDVRYYLNGILLEFNGNQMTAVATDGHRLAISHTQLTNTVENPISIIIPRKGTLELLRLLNNNDLEIKLQVGDNFICLSLPNLSYTSKLIEGRFPDYKMVIPKNGNKTLVVGRENLKGALSRAAILSHDKHHGIRTEINDQVQKIFATNAENEQSEEELSIDFAGSNGIEIGLNVNYLQDVLSVIPSDQVKMTFSDNNSSILVESNANDIPIDFLLNIEYF